MSLQHAHDEDLGGSELSGVNVSSDGSSSESSATGATTRVPSASGTRTASAWPPPIPPAAQKPPCRHEVCSPSRQKSQVLSDQAKGRSPGRRASGFARPRRCPRPRRRTRDPSGCPRAMPASDGRDAVRPGRRRRARPGRRHRSLHDLRVGQGFHPHVSGAVHQCCSHQFLQNSCHVNCMSFVARCLKVGTVGQYCQQPQRPPRRVGRYRH